MKKRLTLPFVIILLCLSFSISYAYPPSNNYYHVIMLKGDVVKTALNYSSFSYLEFSFTKADTGYTLVAYAKNKDGGKLGDLIKSTPVQGEKPRRLKNIEPGIFRLYFDVMKANNVDGSQDYVLTPKKTKDKNTGKEIDYVSYRFSNKVYKNTATAFNTESIFIQASFEVLDFDLNPSPPY